MNFIGIDNGLDGGITVLDTHGQIVKSMAMPVLKLVKGRIVDVLSIRNDLRFQSPCFVVLEAAQKHSPGVLALCSTWYTFGALEALIKCELKAYETINPMKWQKEFWTKPKLAKGQTYNTKAAALHAASKLWPEQDWTKSERATKPHDGMVDSALIAEFGRRKMK